MINAMYYRYSLLVSRSNKEEKAVWLRETNSLHTTHDMSLQPSHATFVVILYIYGKACYMHICIAVVDDKLTEMRTHTYKPANIS